MINVAKIIIFVVLSIKIHLRRIFRSERNHGTKNKIKLSIKAIK